MATPQPGETWIDRRPMTDRCELRDATKFRRYVTVTAHDGSFTEGKSGWQQRVGRRWAEMNYPPERTTRIRSHVFLRRFTRDEET